MSEVTGGLIRRNVVSFGRRDGRLGGRAVREWDEAQSAYLVAHPTGERDTSLAPGWTLDPVAVFGRRAPLIVEIGIGGGEAFVAAATAHPERDHLGVEVYRAGLAQTMASLRSAEMGAGEAGGLRNARLIEADAAELVATGLPEASVDEIRIFFPDPWPKARHHKRRLVQAGFLSDAARVLRPGGVVRCATDWAEYAQWMREAAAACPDVIDGDAPGWSPRFAERPITKYEQKGLDLGRTIYDLTLVKA